MALVVADRVKDTASGTSSPFTITGAAISGYQSINTGIGTGNNSYFVIDDGLGNWVCFSGTFTVGTSPAGSLTVDSILSSSTGGTLPSFSAGDKIVFCTLPAGQAVYQDTSENVTVIGTINATNFNSLSDQSLKHNIKEIDNGLEIINQILAVEFDWNKDGTHSSGIIAQQLETILPYLVHTNEEGVKNVNYSGLIAFLISAVKELSNKIDKLEGN